MKIIISKNIKNNKVAQNRMNYFNIGHNNLRNMNRDFFEKQYDEKMWVITSDFEIHVVDYDEKSHKYTHGDFPRSITSDMIAKGRWDKNIKTGEERVSVIANSSADNSSILQNRQIERVLKRTFPNAAIYGFD